MNIAVTEINRQEHETRVRGATLPLRVLIMDREPIVIRGLAEFLGKNADFHLCGEATTIAQATDLIQSERPDIVLSEISFADGNLLNWIEDYQASWSGLKFIIFTSCSDCVALQRAMRHNVSGFILKRSHVETILHALQSVRNGGVYVDPVILGKAIGKQSQRLETLEEALSGVAARPSDREFDTLRLVAFGYSNKEIARQLGVSPKSIETYKARANQKLGLTSRASIVRYAVANGWFDDDSMALEQK